MKNYFIMAQSGSAFLLVEKTDNHYTWTMIPYNSHLSSHSICTMELYVNNELPERVTAHWNGFNYNLSNLN